MAFLRLGGNFFSPPSQSSAERCNAQTATPHPEGSHDSYQFGVGSVWTGERGRESANIMPAFGWRVCDDSEIFQVSKQHWGRHSEEEMVQRGRDKKRVVFPYG